MYSNSLHILTLERIFIIPMFGDFIDWASYYLKFDHFSTILINFYRMNFKLFAKYD